MDTTASFRTKIPRRSSPPTTRASSTSRKRTSKKPRQQSRPGKTLGQLENSTARQLKCPHKFYNNPSKVEKRENSEDRITAAILEEALSAEHTEALAENLNERCKNLQFEEGLNRSGSGSPHPKETGAQHLDRFRPMACFITTRKQVGYLRLMTIENIKFGSFQSGTLHSQQHKPTRRKLSTTLDTNKAQKATKAHGVGKTALGMDPETVGTTQSRTVARTLTSRQEHSKTTRGLPQGRDPNGVHKLGGHSTLSTEQTMVER